MCAYVYIYEHAFEHFTHMPVIVPVGGGKKAESTFIPSLIDIAINEKKKMEMDRRQWEARNKAKALEQEENASRDAKKALLARAQAQRLIIK